MGIYTNNDERLTSAMLVELGLPEHAHFAPGCGRTSPIPTDEDSLHKLGGRRNAGHADWMSWAED